MHTCGLEATCAVDESLLGGKAANLVRLNRLTSVQVPPGFCVLSTAFREFIAGMALADAMADITDIDKFSEQAQERIKAKPVPTYMADEIQRSLEGYRPPFAVRSSAAVEDAKDNSFAGQQDSYLNVRPHDVVSAVRDCWASLYNANALHYRTHTNVPRIGDIAVVVQEMVDTVAAGVLLTGDPLGDDPDAFIVEAAWGLGCYVVGGELVPDNYRISKKDGSVIYSEISRKHKMMLCIDGKNKDIDIVQRPLATESTLDAHDIRELHQIGMAIEERFGCPQDVEFAKDLRRIYVVQTRPLQMSGTEIHGS